MYRFFLWSTRLRYYWIGSGENVVVYLHGWGGNANSLECIASFDTCRCLMIDCNMEHDVRPLSIYCYALEVFSLLQSLRIQKCSVVAHSFGGRIAILLSSIFDIVIEKLVFIASAGLSYRFSMKQQIHRLQYRFAKYLVKKGWKDQKVLDTYGSEEYKVLQPQDKISFGKVVRTSLEKYLSTISCSVLLIWGDKDKTTPLYFAKRMKRKIKDCGLVVYPGTDHFVYLQKKNEVKNVLSYFLGGMHESVSYHDGR